MSMGAQDVADVLRRERGVDISSYDAGYVRKTVEKRMLALGCEDVQEYSCVLRSSGDEISALLRQLVNTWSEFFRDPLAFAYLENIVLPLLRDGLRLRQPGAIRAWSAGCSTGQEAWSLAILLEELCSERDERVPYQLFATDSSQQVLVQARNGVYDLAVAGDVRLRHLKRYLLREGQQLRVAPALFSNVSFEQHDLLDVQSHCPPSCVYGDFDIILCCNLLMYYRGDIRQYILEKLSRCLSTGGYLMVGSAEREIVLSSGYYTTVCPYIPVFQPIHERI